MDTPKNINTTKAAKPVGAYPHAKKAGNLLFLSGIGPRRAGDGLIPGLERDEKGNFVTFDFEAQVHSVFDNIKAVLAASDASLNDLVDVTVFLVNMERDFNVFNKIYASYFPDEKPCRTTMEVNCLPTPIAIELKCIAYLS